VIVVSWRIIWQAALNADVMDSALACFARSSEHDTAQLHLGTLLHRGTTAVASISTRAAFSTRRTTWTSAMAG